MNLVMNDLRNSMNIATLDATMQITYVNDITDDLVDKVIGIWKKHGNRQTEFNPNSEKKSVLFLLTFMFYGHLINCIFLCVHFFK